MKLFVCLALFLLVGCASGEMSFSSPEAYKIVTSKKIGLSKDEAWKILIQELSKSFFVVNNIEKDSGFINVSYYADDPAKVIDGGRMSAWVSDIHGRRDYHITFADHKAVYEAYMKGAIWSVRRTLDCEGRINISLQEATAGSCLLTVNVKYILTYDGVAQTNVPNGNGGYNTISQSTRDTCNFNSNSAGTIVERTVCPTGFLEEAILAFFPSEKPEPPGRVDRGD